LNKEYEDIFSELNRHGVLGAALVSREGMVQYSDLPVGVHQETFGIMVATMVGAAKAANSELDRSTPSKVIVDSPEGRVVVVTAGPKNILSVVVDSTFELAPLFKYLNKAVSNLNG